MQLARRERLKERRLQPPRFVRVRCTQRGAIMKRSALKRKESRTAWFFVIPFLAGLVVFNVFPILFTFFLSVVDFNKMGPLKDFRFIGLQNFIRVFQDKWVWAAFGRTAVYAAIYVPGVTFGALLLAMLMNRKFRFRGISRTFMLFPYVANVVAVAIIWAILLNPYDGPINGFLKAVGIENPPMWLGGVNTALPTVAVIAVWQNMAFQMVTFLAALQEIPEELNESACLDGANKWQKFRHITLPMISPTTFFLLMTAVLGSAQNFSIIKSITDGGPGRASEVISIYIYNTAFELSHYSVASAESVVLFFILMIITVIQWKGQKTWVHY